VAQRTLKIFRKPRNEWNIIRAINKSAALPCFLFATLSLREILPQRAVIQSKMIPMGPVNPCRLSGINPSPTYHLAPKAIKTDKIAAWRIRSPILWWRSNSSRRVSPFNSRLFFFQPYCHHIQLRIAIAVMGCSNRITALSTSIILR